MMQNKKEKTNTNLTIYQKYMELIYYTNDILKKYPKSETFALVKEIKSNLYTGLRLLMYGIKTYHKQEKLKYLQYVRIIIFTKYLLIKKAMI